MLLPEKEEENDIKREEKITINVKRPFKMY